MLGLALLAPYFVWMIGRSLADLPLAQRILSAVLRTAFVALLALGLARLARTATTQKVCTVYLVDVSDSVPDASLEDARAAIQKGLDAKPEDAIVRVVTFARRPRVVPLGDGDKTMPPIARHDAQRAGAARREDRRSARGPTSRPRSSSPTASTRRVTSVARSSSPTACRPTAISSPRRTARDASA